MLHKVASRKKTSGEVFLGISRYNACLPQSRQQKKQIFEREALSPLCKHEPRIIDHSPQCMLSPENPVARISFQNVANKGIDVFVHIPTFETKKWLKVFVPTTQDAFYEYCLSYRIVKAERHIAEKRLLLPQFH